MLSVNGDYVFFEKIHIYDKKNNNKQERVFALKPSASPHVSEIESNRFRPFSAFTFYPGHQQVYVHLYTYIYNIFLYRWTI